MTTRAPTATAATDRPAPRQPDQSDAADADERADRGCHQARVVAVEDALGLAEHHGAEQQPAAEEHGGGELGPLPPEGPDGDDGADGGGGEEPGDLAADGVAEHPQPTGRTAEDAPRPARARRRGRHRRRAAALPVAVDAAEAVVAEDEVGDGVVGAAADVRPAARGHEVDRHHPRQPATSNDTAGATAPLPRRAPPAPLLPSTAAMPMAGTGMHGAEHLGVEREADRARRRRASHAHQRRDSSERRTAHAAATRNRIMNGLGQVEPVDGHADRADGEHEGGHEGGARRRTAAHGAPEHADGGRAGDGARQQEAPARVAEDPRAQGRFDPQGHGRLVDA